MKIQDEQNFNFAVVSAIIEREKGGEIEVLMQTRWKPERDPVYSGTLEIPAGCIDRHENVYEAVKREVFEETGLHVVSFHPDIKSRVFGPKDDDCFAFVPFCGQQQLKGGHPRLGFVFICRVVEGEPVPSAHEVRDIQWMGKPELRRMIEEEPERIFTLQLGVLDYYLNMTDE